MAELHLANAQEERVDLINCLNWCMAENGLRKGYRVAVKAYSSLPHGQSQEAVEDFVGTDDLRFGVGQFRHRVSREVHWAAWSTAISSVLVNEGTVPMWFVPVVDLEIDATGDPLRDLDSVAGHLISVGYTGTFLQSGDSGSGSYFFVGDRVMSYEIDFIRYFGMMMVALLDWQAVGDEAKQNRMASLQIGDKILGTHNREEAQQAARGALDIFQSIPSGNRRPGLEFDPRWLLRRFLEEKTYIRYTPGKGYEDRPLAVAELY
jgi:hypothetical protein